MQGMDSTGTSMGMFNTQLPQLNGKNYDYWAITMRALFSSQDLWELVEEGFEEPADENVFTRLTQAEKDLLKSNRKMLSLGSRNLMAKTSHCGRCRWKIICIRKTYTYHWEENQICRRV